MHQGIMIKDFEYFDWNHFCMQDREIITIGVMVVCIFFLRISKSAMVNCRPWIFMCFLLIQLNHWYPDGVKIENDRSFWRWQHDENNIIILTINSLTQALNIRNVFSVSHFLRVHRCLQWEEKCNMLCRMDINDLHW